MPRKKPGNNQFNEKRWELDLDHKKQLESNEGTSAEYDSNMEEDISEIKNDSKRYLSEGSEMSPKGISSESQGTCKDISKWNRE